MGLPCFYVSVLQISTNQTKYINLIPEEKTLHAWGLGGKQMSMFILTLQCEKANLRRVIKSMSTGSVPFKYQLLIAVM